MMRASSLHDRCGKWAASAVVALSCIALSGAMGARESQDDEGSDDGKIPLTVPKAVCGPNDHPETALQGQVPAALRAAGFKGFNCNLKLLGQSKGDGANWQAAEFRDRDGGDREREKDRDRNGGSRICAYHGTASPTASLPARNSASYGVPVIDLTDPNKPTRTG